MRLYDRLLQRKQHGEKLDMKKISYEDLYHLWWREDCSDGEIAELYDVPRKKVTNLRQTWNIKLIEIIVHEFEEKFSGEIPLTQDGDEASVPTGAPIPVSDRSAEQIHPTSVALLLRKIEGLNDSEFESLRLELARRYPAFAGIKNDAEFSNAIERAVQDFSFKKS